MSFIYMTTYALKYNIWIVFKLRSTFSWSNSWFISRVIWRTWWEYIVLANRTFELFLLDSLANSGVHFLDGMLIFVSLDEFHEWENWISSRKTDESTLLLITYFISIVLVVESNHCSIWSFVYLFAYILDGFHKIAKFNVDDSIKYFQEERGVSDNPTIINFILIANIA